MKSNCNRVSNMYISKQIRFAVYVVYISDSDDSATLGDGVVRIKYENICLCIYIIVLILFCMRVLSIGNRRTVAEIYKEFIYIESSQTEKVICMNIYILPCNKM